jgi:hypothetical protein
MFFIISLFIGLIIAISAELLRRVATVWRVVAITILSGIVIYVACGIASVRTHVKMLNLFYMHKEEEAKRGQVEFCHFLGLPERETTEKCDHATQIENPTPRRDVSCDQSGQLSK